MKSFSGRIFYSLIFSLLVTMLPAQSVVTQTFGFTGTTQTFVTPSCISEITVVIAGGGGGSSPWAGGAAGMVSVALTPTPGQILYVNVGGAGGLGTGGWNGGGNGGVGSSSTGRGGGGATDIRLTNNSLTNRIIVMAGGGGCGSIPWQISDGGNAYVYPFTCPTLFGSGGAGGTGGATGGPGLCAGGTATLFGTGGAGGGMTSGGGLSGGGGGGYGQAGSLAQGGNGGGATAIYGGSGGGVHGAGGGGGGYFGGAGGMCGVASSPWSWCGGGGAGSSYIDTTLFTYIGPGGVWSMDGIVLMKYSYTNPSLALSGPSTACSGSSITLSASGASNYTWLPVANFPGSNSTSVSISPTATTIYTVVGSNTANCLSSATLTVTVPPPLIISVVNSASLSGGVCPGRTATLTASGATTYLWTGGITNGISFTPTVSQTYTVTGSNGCSSGTAVASISLHPLPTVSFVPQGTVCAGNPVHLTGAGANTYTWNGILPNATIIFPSTSMTFTVIGTSALGCTNSAVQPVTIFNTFTLTPVASASAICSGSSVTITANGASSYSWNQGATTSSIVVSPTVNTSYTVTHTIGFCSSSKTVDIIVYSVPQPVASANSTMVCASYPITLNASGALSYTWTAPPAFYVTITNPVVYPVASTIYTLTASNGSCVNSTTLQIATMPSPTINVSQSSSVICVGNSVAVNGTGGVSYTLNTIPPTIFTNSTVVSPTITSYYTLTGAGSNGCTAASQQTVFVNPLPNVTAATNKLLICPGGTAFLTASGAATYQWDANANSAVTATTVVTPLSNTVYSVSGSYTTGCSKSATVMVQVFNSTLIVSGLTSGCVGDTISLIASGANTYTWNGVFGAPSQTWIPATSTVFTLAATASSNAVNCIATKTIAITIYPNPTLTIVPDRTALCRGETVTLTASGANTYTWGTSQTVTVLIIPVFSSQPIYMLKGTDLNGCEATSSISIKVSECTGISENSEAPRNIFVYPNPAEFEFNIQSNETLQIEITNELGQIIREITLNPENGFTSHVMELAEGIYLIREQKSLSKGIKFVILR